MLNAKPTANVVIEISTDDSTEGMITGGDYPNTPVESLDVTFTPEDWSTAQQIIVTGQDDDVADGNQSYIIITAPAISDDPIFSGVDPENISVFNSDNDVPGLTINSLNNLDTSETGGTALFAVVLNTRPDGVVVLDVETSDASEGLVSGGNSIGMSIELLQLTFTPEDWTTPQTVTINGIADEENDADQEYQISVSPNTEETDDTTGYVFLGLESVAVINRDDFLLFKNFPNSKSIFDAPKKYLIVNLEPNTLYNISLTELTDNIDLSVYADNSWGDAECTSSNSLTTDEVCVTESNDSGKLWVSVAGKDLEMDSTFTLNVTVYAGVFSEGTRNSPVSLTFDKGLNYAGSTSPLHSYYQVTGLVANTVYKISLTGLSDNTNLFVYSDSSLETLECQSWNWRKVDRYCFANSDGSGNLWIKVDGAAAIEGATYSISMVPYLGLSAEGSKSSPALLVFENDFPYEGTVSPVNSYYRFSGLEANTLYSISMDAWTDNVWFSVFDDNAWEMSICNSRYKEGDIQACVAASDSSGELLIMANGENAEEGATFNINIAAYTDLPSEGSLTTPVLLSYETDFPHEGTTSPIGSYYQIAGLAANTLYSVSISEMTDDFNFYVYSNAAWDWKQLGCVSIKWESNSGICTLITDSAGNLWIKVNGSPTISGATFTLNVIEYSGLLSEGSETIPVALSYNSDLPYEGTTSPLRSYYHVTGLEPNTLQVISLTDLTANADLYVYVDSWEALECYSWKWGMTDEICFTASNSSGELWIKVDGASTIEGANFTLGVIPSPFKVTN